MSNQSEPLSDRAVKAQQIGVLGIAEGFFQSSVLFALLKLRVFERIDEGTTKLEDLASAMGVRAETLSRLLNAAVMLKLLATRDGIHFDIAPTCRSVLLPSAGQNYLGDWIRTLDFFCGPLQKLDEAVLKSGPVINPTTHLGGDKEQTRSFALAMHNYAALRGKELAMFLSTAGTRSLLDLGCGPGTYAFCLATANPSLEIHLADHPVVLDTTRQIARSYDLVNRVHYLAMDALREQIPGSYDMVLVSNVLHGLGEVESRTLIKRLYEVVNRGGSLVIQAQFLRDDGVSDRWPIFLDLIQLCVTTEGRNHAPGETRSWMEEAGFTDIKYHKMTLLNTNGFLRGYRR